MDDQKKILDEINRHQRFLVAAHHNPDADAAASSLSVAIMLKTMGKKVVVVNEDDLPQWLKFLPQAKLSKKAKAVKPFVYDVAIMCDCGDLERIGGVKSLLIAGKPMINIDHHVTNTRFGTVNWVGKDTSSTSEMIYDLLQYARIGINKQLAHLLYVGIMTDTGSFRYDNVSAKTHAIVADLMRFKINAQDMYERLYVGMPVVDMKLFAKVIQDAQLSHDDKVFCVSLSFQSSQIFSKSFDLKDKLFGFLRSVEGIEVVVILTQINSKEVRINLRSQGPVNVAKLAQLFNGGGHPKAAGGKMAGSLENVKKRVLNALKKVL